MSSTHQVQLLMLVLIMGFLAGPRVMEAIQQSEPITGSKVAAVAVEHHDQNESKPGIISKETAYAHLSLEAKSVYVWDISTHKTLFASHEQEILPLASVTKMMMALVAKDLLPADKQVTISESDLQEEGNSGLVVGEKWSLESLLKFTLVSSSNDGASAIASVAGASLLRIGSTTDPFQNKKLFIDKMNEKAREIGLTSTRFSNESGLDIDSVTSGAYGTSRDMAMLFEYIYRKHPELFSATAYPNITIRSEDGISHHVANTNEGVATVSGLIGSKTGFTDLAGGNLVVVIDVGIEHPVAIVVLGSTRTGRFLDTEKLISATVTEITGLALSPKDADHTSDK